MSVVYILSILLIFSYSNAHAYNNILIKSENNHNLLTCVTEIVQTYYKSPKISYIDVEYGDNEIIKLLHTLQKAVVISYAGKNVRTTSYHYIIAASTAKDFTRNFEKLLKESFWNPDAFFLIVIKYLKSRDLRHIFDVLLKYHVNHATILNGTNNADLYSYNPFDNYNCGKRYDKVIKLGKCLEPEVDNFYPPKLVTGLRNCTFNATISHWPPYGIDPTISNDTEIGAEQYIFEIISEIENFKIHYTESISGEEFSTIYDNMSVSGDLFMLEEKRTDIIFGGMILIHSRARVFDFLCGHLPYMDEVRVLVKKAGPVANWKYYLLEFQTAVWLVLIGSFLCYFVLITMVLRVKDKISLFLLMIELFFMHGSKKIFKSRNIFIMWVFFAYLISVYYQSSLVSIMSHPNNEYQISTDEDLIHYKIEPCISVGLQKYLREVRSDQLELRYQDGCVKLLDSIQSVKNSSSIYTISLLSIYRYNRHMFYDEESGDSIYIFKSPINSVIYAYYLYRGFPLYNKLNLLTITLRENGLIDRYIKNLYEKRLMKFMKTTAQTSSRKYVVFPWYIFVVGYIAATGCFLVELLSKEKHHPSKLDLST